MKQSYVEIVGSREHGPTVVFKRFGFLEELGKFLRRNDYLSVRGWRYGAAIVSFAIALAALTRVSYSGWPL